MKTEAKYMGVQTVTLKNTQIKANKMDEIRHLSCCFVPPTTVLPEELGSWWTQLQDATDEALALI